MTGELIINKALEPIVLEANGASIANNALAQADDAIYDIFADGEGRPDAKFILSVTYATAPTEGTLLSLYARPLDIEGTNDAEVPEATRPTVLIGHFAVNNVTTTQYIELLAEDVPWKAAYYLHNNGTGQTVSVGWGLGVIPFTRGQAA